MTRFRVYGLPAPQGSKRGFATKSGRVAMVESSKKVKPWREAVSWAAREVYRGPLLTGPVVLACVFILPRPKSHYRTGKHAGELRPDAPTFSTKYPDCSKAIRSTEDALTGIVWRDDAQVIDFGVKLYGERPGALVFVAEVKMLAEVQALVGMALDAARVEGT